VYGGYVLPEVASMEKGNVTFGALMRTPACMRLHVRVKATTLREAGPTPSDTAYVWFIIIVCALVPI
jgi:hypothetical protein